MTGSPSSFPLVWPGSWPRTPPDRRQRPLFTSVSASARDTRKGRLQIRLTDARERLADELDKLNARAIVLSTNLELRADGQPRAGLPEPADPGAAVYFEMKQRPTVLACDRWTTVAGNVAAIAAHIGALRAQERWGVGSIEQAFTGYAALPPAMVVDDWQAVLGTPKTLAEANESFKRQMMRAHPDRGGSVAEAARLNAAIARARQVLRV